MRHATARPADGFTLIEVMVALAIVAITLGAGIKAAGALSNNAERLAQVSEAQWCADNMLTGLRLAHQSLSVGDSDFACDQLGRSYRGKLVIRPTPNPNFRRVDATMSNEAGQPVLTLSTVLPRAGT
jgi:general secretion pathway protein I